MHHITFFRFFLNLKNKKYLHNYFRKALILKYDKISLGSFSEGC